MKSIVSSYTIQHTNCTKHGIMAFGCSCICTAFDTLQELNNDVSEDLLLQTVAKTIHEAARILFLYIRIDVTTLCTVIRNLD